LTSNSLQFGAGIRLKAKLGPAKGEAWLTLDALFKWSPRFYFEVRISAGISISVFGVDVFGVDFKGTLKGTTPWTIEGHASISLLFWDFDFDLGPFTWGDKDTSSLPTVSPRAIIAEALTDPDAWTMELPPNTDTFIELIEDNETPLLVHPLGALEVKQLKAPLETTIDRIGSSKVSESRVHLASPTVQGVAANVVSHAEDRFAPGQFIKLKDEEQVSRAAFETMPAGMRVAASSGASFGPSSSVALEWETAFPKEPGLQRVRSRLALTGRARRVALRTSRVAQARRLRSNPYLGGTDPVTIADSAMREVRRRDDLGAVLEAPKAMTATHAASLIQSLDPNAFELVAPGSAS
ncbi:MAG: hypothetical protein KDA28_04995, partial [Phycisphaerales bacterium]|nr:hypothetical protein [Phycisphaerales bacterium]